MLKRICCACCVVYILWIVIIEYDILCHVAMIFAYILEHYISSVKC